MLGKPRLSNPNCRRSLAASVAYPRLHSAERRYQPSSACSLIPQNPAKPFGPSITRVQVALRASVGSREESRQLLAGVALGDLELHVGGHLVIRRQGDERVEVGFSEVPQTDTLAGQDEHREAAKFFDRTAR